MRPPSAAPWTTTLRESVVLRPALHAAVLAGGYLIAATAYIIFSSEAAATVAASIPELGFVEQVKGVLFVVVTGVAFYLFAWAVLSRLRQREAEAASHLEALTAAENRAVAGALASAVAHDIRNALTASTVELELLLESAHLAADDRRAVEDVRAANRQIIELAQRLSDAGRERLGAESNTSFDLAAVLREVTHLCGRHRALRPHHLDTHGLDIPCPMTGNRLLITRAVTNLVINAGEAMAEVGAVLVSLEWNRDGTVTIMVDDAGPGIPRERRETIFEAFHTTKATGTGVGLTSVQMCAEHHGGTVRIDTSPLGGARFALTLQTQSPGAAAA